MTDRGKTEREKIDIYVKTETDRERQTKKNRHPNRTNERKRKGDRKKERGKNFLERERDERESWRD